MNKILLFFDTPQSKSDGISSHCEALLDLFKENDNIILVKANNMERKYSSFWKRHYYSHFTELLKYLKCDSAKIVHVHGLASFCSMQVIIAAKLAKKKVVFSPHYHPFDAMNHPLRMKLFWMFIMKHIVSQVDAIVTINNEDTTFFEQIHRNVKMMSHWISCDLTNEVAVKKKQNIILFVGRNDSNKRIDMLYDLPFSKYEVHCVTDGNVCRSDFILHSNVSNEELTHLYKEASLLVVPSRYEAFSLVAMEALWNNTPIVASDRVRIIDHLEKCKSGYDVFPYDDKFAFYESIAKTIGNNVDMRFVKEYFSADRIKREYISLYSSM